MTPRPRTAIALTALTALVVVLAGCDVQPKPAPSATALPSGITATLLPATPAQQSDQVRLWVENTTDENLALSRIRIDDPHFDGIGRKTAAGGIEVTAGRSAEIVVALPPIDCAADQPAPTASPSATGSPTAAGDGATATIGFALGAAIGIAVTAVDDPTGVIASRVAAACG